MKKEMKKETLAPNNGLIVMAGADWILGRLLALGLSMSSGFNITESGLIRCCPTRSGILLSRRSSARSNGEAPFIPSRAVEFIWLAMRLMSSWVYLFMLLTFGMT